MESSPDHHPHHNQLIVDQFTRQAIPFATMPVLDDAQTNRLVITTADIQPTDTVLDVACGPGLITCAIAQVARQVTGIDITPAMIDQAKRRQEVKHLTNMDWRIGDILPLPFPYASFSAVITRYSFHHFPDPRAVLAEMSRVCQPDGKVAVVDMFTSSPEQAEGLNEVEKLRDPSHARALSLDELKSAFAACSLHHLRTAFYKVPNELENILARSFPNPGDVDKIRQIFQRDIGINRLGLDATLQDGKIHFAYPIVIVVGYK
jgi:ubiquinone/menaquinone biosynthesis C-methylase UbiE